MDSRKSPKDWVQNLGLLIKNQTILRWLKTVFDTCVSFTFFSKTLDPFVTKNGNKQDNNTNFSF